MVVSMATRKFSWISWIAGDRFETNGTVVLVCRLRDFMEKIVSALYDRSILICDRVLCGPESLFLLLFISVSVCFPVQSGNMTHPLFKSYSSFRVSFFCNTYLVDYRWPAGALHQSFTHCDSTKLAYGFMSCLQLRAKISRGGGEILQFRSDLCSGASFSDHYSTRNREYKMWTYNALIFVLLLLLYRQARG